MEPVRKVKQNRNAALFIFLSIITFSIYEWVFFSSFVDDVNTICEEDGRHTRDVVTAFLLSLLTFGIYGYVWFLGMVDRMGESAWKYGIHTRRSSVALLILMLLLPWFGSIIAICLVISDMNRLADAYTQMHENAVGGYAAPQSNNNTAISLPPVKDPPKECGALFGLTGVYAGQKIPLQRNQKVTLGRSPATASLVIEGEKISRVHCVIQYNGNQLGYNVTDQSQNGVWIDGKRINYNLPTYAAPGAIVALADGVNKFQLM